MQSLLTVTVKGAKKAQKTLRRERQREVRAFETAVKVEGFRLRKVLQQEIRAGAPGGEAFAPLTSLARGLGIRTSRRIRKDRPLIRLANAIYYEMDSGRDFKMRIGFTKRAAPFMRDLAEMHQKGFERPISKKLRRLIIREGGRRGKIEGGRTPFFLKKSTKTFKTPARRIVDPFWAAHKDEAWRNIRANYRIKLSGRRI